MKFQIGDLVVLKHTKAEGKIVGIENEEMFLVLIDGVEIPVFKENIDHPYFDWFTDDKYKKKQLKTISIEQMPKEKISEGSHWDQGIYLAFFPVYDDRNDELIEKFKVYLINQDRESLSFSYKSSLAGKSLFSISSRVIPYANFYLHDVSMEVMHDIPLFELKLSYQDAVAGLMKCQADIRLRAKKLFQFIQQLNHSEISYIHIPIDKSLFGSPEDGKSVEVTVRAETKIENDIRRNKRIDEVDVHIEKLTSAYQKLSNAEIIQIQLSHFEQVLQHVISLNQDSLTVIHGVGKGVLKEEIHNLLRMYKEVRHFISEWSPKYGYGATQVFFYT